MAGLFKKNFVEFCLQIHTSHPLNEKAQNEKVSQKLAQIPFIYCFFLLLLIKENDKKYQTEYCCCPNLTQRLCYVHCFFFTFFVICVCVCIHFFFLLSRWIYFKMRYIKIQSNYWTVISDWQKMIELRKSMKRTLLDSLQWLPLQKITFTMILLAQEYDTKMNQMETNLKDGLKVRK